MSFAEDVKNELCQYEASSDADVAMKIEASCLLRMGGSIILGMKGAVGIRLATANNAVARRLLGILKKQYELPTNVLVRQGLNLRKKNMYTLSVEPSVEGRQALENLALWPVSEQIPRSWLKSMEARRAFLRGAFLGGGSVNKPQSDYHLPKHRLDQKLEQSRLDPLVNGLREALPHEGDREQLHQNLQRRNCAWYQG